MNILDKIVAQKKVEVAKLPQRAVSPKNLQNAALARGGLLDFGTALRRPQRGGMALIAEVKKASPSAGIICADFDAVRIAQKYEIAGADCLSVLTDEQFFQGSLAYLKAIRDIVKLPLLRKDFIIDERQILEAVEWGADAILLIVAILSDEQLRHFHELTTEGGLTALVEVHDEGELERALAIGAKVIGVNNRDLKTFKTDLATTERLSAKLRGTADGKDKVLVAESGIHTRADVVRLAKCGAQAILVGESLMKGANVQEKVAELLDGN